MEECTVVVEWEMVEDRSKVLDLNGEKDYGVYQITGYHNVFGDDSLLYIGMAKDQTFGARFKGHQAWLDKEWGTTIYVGRVASINDDKEYNDRLWESVIGDVEALLGVPLDDPEFHVGYLSGLAQNLGRDRNLSDIVDDPGHMDALDRAV